VFLVVGSEMIDMPAIPLRSLLSAGQAAGGGTCGRWITAGASRAVAGSTLCSGAVMFLPR
jgi:hypothetical protein